MSNVVMFSGATALKQDTDRRNAPRHRVLKSGKVAFQSRYSVIGCTVRDISDTGARLRTNHSVSIPDNFELIIETDGLEVDCEVAWRRGNEVGVRFIGGRKVVAPRQVQILQADIERKKPSLLKRSIQIG